MIIRRVKLIGADAHGLIEQLTRYTSDVGCNIITLEAESVPANHAGYDLFHARLTLWVPRSLSEAAFKDALSELGEQMGVDIHVLEQGGSEDSGS